MLGLVVNPSMMPWCSHFSISFWLAESIKICICISFEFFRNRMRRIAPKDWFQACQIRDAVHGPSFGSGGVQAEIRASFERPAHCSCPDELELPMKCQHRPKQIVGSDRSRAIRAVRLSTVSEFLLDRQEGRR